MRLAPDSPIFQLDRGRVLALKGEGARALADFDRAIALGLVDAEILDARAAIRESLGNAPGARSDRESAARLRSGPAPARR